MTNDQWVKHRTYFIPATQKELILRFLQTQTHTTASRTRIRTLCGLLIVILMAPLNLCNVRITERTRGNTNFIFFLTFKKKNTKIYFYAFIFAVVFVTAKQEREFSVSTGLVTATRCTAVRLNKDSFLLYFEPTKSSDYTMCGLISCLCAYIVCSRLVNDLMNSVDDLDTSFHCSSNGNFEPLQCNRGSCYCADIYTGQPTSIVVPEPLWTILTCCMYFQNELRKIFLVIIILTTVMSCMFFFF